MTRSPRLARRVARRFEAAVLFRTGPEEAIATCPAGCSIGTWDVLRLLVAQGIEPTEVRFTKRLAENIARFEATTETGMKVTGTVTIKTRCMPEKIDAYAVVLLDDSATPG